VIPQGVFVASIGHAKIQIVLHCIRAARHVAANKEIPGPRGTRDGGPIQINLIDPVPLTIEEEIIFPACILRLVGRCSAPDDDIVLNDIRPDPIRFHQDRIAHCPSDYIIANRVP